MPPTTKMATMLPMRVARRLMRRRGGSASAKGACESCSDCGSMDLLVGAEAHPDPQGNASAPWSLIVMPPPGYIAPRRYISCKETAFGFTPGVHVGTY